MPSKEEEKRIKRIVYCAEQLVEKKHLVWLTRYQRACKNAKSVSELDKALERIHAKYPHLGLDKIVKEARSEAN